MKRALAVAFGLSALFTGMSEARAEISVSVGAEHYKWAESIPAPTPNVRETGLRWALDLTWTQSKEPGFSAGYNLKLYTGNPDYDGALIGSVAPVSAEAHYHGYKNEFQLIYRTASLTSSPLEFLTALGWDHWDRTITGQVETWNVLYAKAGVGWNSATKAGFMASGGIKGPLYTREDAQLADIGFGSNPRLQPGKSISVYGTVGYRFNQGWDVIGYYDSYRFKQSQNVFPLGGGFAFQPESKMDIFGVKVQKNF